MSTSISKSRSPVERSYSSASSTTSSRRSGRRKRRRMKHTVMPLKKRANRSEVPCDVHRVSNLDNEEMAQSACFWVAKNADDPAERNFKEEVFVNKDQDSSDEDVSYLDERRETHTADEFTHTVRTDSRYDAKYDKDDAFYANENEKNDANYLEEKMFYGVRKGKMSDGNDVERISPLPSPRNRSRMSSLSDEGQSGFSSEGAGMHVGWTSDVGVSSEQEYSGMTDEDSDGEGGKSGMKSREFYGYRRRDGEKRETEFPTRKFRERNSNQNGVVIATDVTTTEQNEFQNFESEERKRVFESKRKQNVEIDREFYTKEELESVSYSAYNGGNVDPGINTRRDFESRVPGPRDYDTSEHDREVLLPGGATNTSNGYKHPSSDTELVNFRSFEYDIEKQSDRSLPLGGHKTKTQYYSVEDLIRSTKDEASVEKEGSGSDGPEIPRGYGEYENYEPPRDTSPREDDHAISGSRVEPEPNGIDSERPRVVPSAYDLKAQRPLLVPMREKDFDGRAKENVRDERRNDDEHLGTYEESKEFYGYRRPKPGNEYESENKENLSPHFTKEKDSGRPTKEYKLEENREGFKSTGIGKKFIEQDKQRDIPEENEGPPENNRGFEESREFYGYRNTKTGQEPKDDVDKRQRYEEYRTSGDQSKNTTWEETKEFYGYRQSKTGTHFGRQDSPRYNSKGDNGQPPKQKAWEQNQEFFGYRQSRTGSQQDLCQQDEKKQLSGNTTKTRTWQESREFYGYKTYGSSENLTKDSRRANDGKIWEESREFFGFRRRQVVDGQSHFAVSGHLQRPRSPLQRKLESNEGKPHYLESADVIDKRRDETVQQPRDEITKDESESMVDERITRTGEGDNLMSVDHEQEFDNKFEESREFYGYRTPEHDIPRSSAYEQYQKPVQGPQSEKFQPVGERSTSHRTTTSGYDVTSTSTQYTERESHEQHVKDTLEPDIKDDEMDVYMQPHDSPGEYGPTEEYDPTRKYHSIRKYDPNGDSSDVLYDRQMFNTLEVPSSKKVIPLVSDVAPKIETTTTETATKRLQTRSQRDSLRRETKNPEPTNPGNSDVGMKMFRQRSLPRKHGYPTSSEEKNKELPRKVKKSDEPDLSKCDPDFANKLREIKNKRKNVKTKTTTETATKSAAESCNKNVEELVNVFNTLEHIQKKTGKKTDKNITPRDVKRIVSGETLDKQSGEHGKLSPASSVSQKLDEIENILDSVDKNGQRGTHDKQSHNSQSSEDSKSTRKTIKTYTTRGERARKPDTTEDLITKREAISVESYLADEPSREQPGRPSDIPDRNLPWSYSDAHSPYRADRQRREYDKTRNFRSRDDDDKMYRAQIRKAREESWKDSRTSRKKKYDSKSDGEIEGFSRPFGDRVITPGTPVNIRLYGLNLKKTNQDRSHELNWELFTNNEVPVSESVRRTQLKRQPINVDQIPAVKIPGEKPRTEEPTIDKSQVRPVYGIGFPFEEQKDEPRMRNLSMREQHEPLYRRQERLPTKRDAPIARSDSLDDEAVTSHEIKWSYPPESKVRPEKEPQSKVSRAESPDAKEVMEVDSSLNETNMKTFHRDIKTTSVVIGKQTPDKRPSETQPFEKRPSEKRPKEKRPSRERPSEERSQGKEIFIQKDEEVETNEEPDELVIKVQYTHDFLEDEDQNTLPEQGTPPVQSSSWETKRSVDVHRSSTPKNKPRSPGLSDDIFDEDSRETTHEESSSSERHESTTHVENTTHTTRTTRTTRTETTTETIVKKSRKTWSESSRPETGEPDFIVPVRNEPDFSTPQRSRPDNGTPPEYFTPSAEEPEYITPVYSQPEYAAPEYSTPETGGPTTDQADGEPQGGDEPSLVAHEYIVMNKDTGRPVNLTMLGRVIENDDDDYLASQSREDLFLHTRLKMVTENKKVRKERRNEELDAHLFESNAADQDDVDNEGELTASDDGFDSDAELDRTVPDGEVTEQLLIPISGKDNEKIKKDKRDKARYVLPREDTTGSFKPHEQVDEFVFITDQPTRESITRDSRAFIPRITPEPDLEKEDAPSKKMLDFESIPGFIEPISENVEFSKKPEKSGAFLEFGDEKVQDYANNDIEIVELPPEKSVIDEEVSKERRATPTLPEFEHEPVDESISSEKNDPDLNMPDNPIHKQVQPVDESVLPSTQDPTTIYLPDLEEALPEIRKQPTPTLVDETITSDKREIEVNLPHFSETRPSQPIDEGIIVSEPIKKQVYVPDFQELIPETKKPVTPVDENVISERREIELNIPELQVAEPERQASEPITEQISADEPISSDVCNPDFSEISVEFQEVVPEFPESSILNEDMETAIDDEEKIIQMPGFQKAVQEPVRNVAITDSDLEVEAPTSSSSESLSAESELSITTEKIDIGSPEHHDVYKTPEEEIPVKDTAEKDIPKKYTQEEETPGKTVPEIETQEDETWSETRVENKTVKETRTIETVTVEETITTFVSEVPPKKDEPVSPTRNVHFARSNKPKDSSESSSELSSRSSSRASADVSDRSTDVTPEILGADKQEVAARKRRSRRGNRFDSIKRSGSLVPESVVRDESPGSNVRRTDVPRIEYSGVMLPVDTKPVVAEREQSVSNVPDIAIPIFTPREKPTRMRPEMYLLDSDDENQGGDSKKSDERVVAEETCVPQDKDEILEETPPQSSGEDLPDEDEIPARDELSPELIDELLEKEIRGLAEDTESLGTNEEPEVVEEITKEDSKQQVPELESLPEDAPEVPIDEQIDEAVLDEEKFNDDETPTEIAKEIETSLSKNKPHWSDENENFSVEEVEPAIEQEQSSTDEPQELVEKISDDEQALQDEVLPENAQEEPFETPDEAPEGEETDVPKIEDFEVILIEDFNKDDNDVIDKDDDVIDKDDEVMDNDDDAMDKDDVIYKRDDDVIEESTVETVIVEKTHSEVSTTVTEITTTRYPSPLRDIPTTSSEIPQDATESPTEYEDGFVKIPIDIAKPDEFVQSCEDETVEGIPEGDDQPTYEQPTKHDDIPIIIVAKEPNGQLTSGSESDKESSDSESSTTESDDERTDGSVGKVTSTETIFEVTNPGTDTVFGIVDIKYEKPQSEKLFVLEKTEESFIEIREAPEISNKISQSDDNSEKDVLVVALPEHVEVPEDIPSHDEVPTVADQISEEYTAPRELNIDIAHADEESTTSSDDELTIEDKSVPGGISESTIETIIVEKTNIQISTTITKVPVSSDDEEQDVPVTTPEDTMANDDILISEKPPSTPEVNITVVDVPAHEESTTSSDKESTTDEEKEPSEIPESTVETIIVEKTHSQVSTTITEITANNVPNYPIGSRIDVEVLAGETAIMEDVPTTDEAPTLVESVPTSEDIPKSEYAPSFADYQTAEDRPIAEDAPKIEEIPIYEVSPIGDGSDELVFEILPAVQAEDVDGLEPKDGHVTKIGTVERESQTENRDVYCEATQTENTTEITRRSTGATRDAYSMTPKRTLSDSEIQTEIPRGSASTQTNSETDSQWYSYTRTVEELQESSETVTTINRQCSNSETQTDIPVFDSETQTQSHVTSESSSMTDDDFRIIPTTSEGTQTEEERQGGYLGESEVTRITRRTTTETKSTYKDEIDMSHSSSPPRDELKTDCPVCFQSLESTNYSFIKVRDISRFTAMEDSSTQYEMQETTNSFCFACGRQGTRRELREGSGHSSTTRDEWEQEELIRDQGETSGFSSTTWEELRQEMSVRDAREYSSTREEWGKDVVLQSESSTEEPEEVHFSIHIDGDEKCLLYCRRSGEHACALQKLASIIKAHREFAHTESSRTSETVQDLESMETANDEYGESMESGTRDVIGPDRCDASVQTDSALLPADFEVFSEKDFEIYYDEQKSPCWFV